MGMNPDRSDLPLNVGQTDMNPVLTSVAAANPDALYFPIFIEAGSLPWH